jgi:hypothetical protein
VHGFWKYKKPGPMSKYHLNVNTGKNIEPALAPSQILTTFTTNFIGIFMLVSSCIIKLHIATCAVRLLNFFEK